MEGTIKIEAIPNMGMTLEMDIHHVSRFDVMAVFDTLAKGFKLDDEERKLIGVTFAMGGINAMPGVKTAALEMSPELLKIVREMRGKNNETDEV